MPIYEYICIDCHTRFDVLRSMKDADAPIECVKCNSDQTSRTISLFNAQSGGKTVAGSSNGCSGCTGGACSSCGL